MTDDHFESLDATLQKAKDAWASEKKALLDRIFALETENALMKDFHARADTGRAAAERVTMKLLTQFATVAAVFEEARQLAIKVGYEAPEEAKKLEEKAKASIEHALGLAEPPQGASVTSPLPEPTPLPTTSPLPNTTGGTGQ